jgi:peptidyl-prolyl cis-trans isomerase B (cyclophilin B)
VPLPATAENRAWTGSITFNKDITLGITLDGAKAPQGVASFIADVKDKYLVGKTCHRLVLTATSGLIQCGSFDGKGSSDTGYSFGPIENAPADGVYPAGTIALARVGDNAYSQGHQFFIVLKPVKLPADTVGGYTIIGTVTSGLAKMLSTIAAGGVAAGGSSATDGPPVVATTITGLSIK